MGELPARRSALARDARRLSIDVRAANRTRRAVAILELERAMASGKRAQHAPMSAAGERTLVTATDLDRARHRYRTCDSSVTSSDAPLSTDTTDAAGRRSRMPHLHCPKTASQLVYVWTAGPRPHLAGPQAARWSMTTTASLRRRGSSRERSRRGDWPTLIAQWLIEVAAERTRKRLQNVDALVVEAQNFLDEIARNS